MPTFANPASDGHWPKAPQGWPVRSSSCKRKYREGPCGCARAYSGEARGLHADFCERHPEVGTEGHGRTFVGWKKVSGGLVLTPAIDALVATGLPPTDAPILNAAIRNQAATLSTLCISQAKATIIRCRRLQAALADGECAEVVKCGKVYIQWLQYQSSTVEGKLRNISVAGEKLVNADTVTALKGFPPNGRPIITDTAFAGPPHRTTDRICTSNKPCGSVPPI